jgi:hypothetical protein
MRNRMDGWRSYCLTFGLGCAVAFLGCGGDSSPRGGPGDASVDVNLSVDAWVASPDSICASIQSRPTRAKASIVFAIDRSGSMNCPPDLLASECAKNPRAVPGKDSKWEILRKALEASLKSVPPDTTVGTLFFGEGTADYGEAACTYAAAPQVEPLPLQERYVEGTHLERIVEVMGSVRPRGGTPLVQSMQRSYRAILTEAQAALARNPYERRRFAVVLVSDGAESCGADVDAFVSGSTSVDASNINTVDSPAKALAFPASIGWPDTSSILTYVLGSPGSEGARRFLSAVAYRGGTPRSANCSHGGSDPAVGNCHFDMTANDDAGADYATKLEAALRTVTTEAVPCEYAMPVPEGGQSLDPNRISVTRTRGNGQATALGRMQLDCTKDANAEGFAYSVDGKALVLCGKTCSEATHDVGTTIDVALGCFDNVPR